MSESLWTVKEVSEYLSLSPWTIYLLVERRKIPHIRFGRSIRFQKSEIDQWLKEKAVPEFDVKGKVKEMLG